MITNRLSRFSLSSRTREILLVLLILLTNLILISPTLMPDFAAINPHDEAKYIESGWYLLHGQVRDLAWAPLVSFLYAPIHLLVGNSPDWFLLEAWIGRFVLTVAISLSLLHLARQLMPHTHPAVIAGILLGSTFIFPILENQSDALFLVFSVFGLARLLRFNRERQLKDAALGSLFTGLSMLCRVEAVLLVGVMAVLSLWIGRKHFKFIKLLAAGTLPAVAVFAAYLLLSLAVMGHINLGVGGKSYDSFEWNQAVLTGGDLEKAYAESRRLFGTAQENNGSVLRAILRNPPAFAERIWANAKNLPDNYLAIFGKTRGFALAFFAALGVYALIRRRHWSILLVLLCWSLPPLVSLGFLTRHLIPQDSFLPVILAAIGLSWVFSAETRAGERLGVTLLAFALALYSLLDAKPGFLMAALLILVVFSATWLLRPRLLAGQYPSLAPLLMMLSVGIILYGQYSFPNYPQLGKTEPEQAIHYLQEAVPPFGNILTPRPFIGIAARLNGLETGIAPGDLTTPEQLQQWMWARNIHAVYVEDRYGVRTDISALLAAGAGSSFEVGYLSESGAVRVYLPVEP